MKTIKDFTGKGSEDDNHKRLATEEPPKEEYWIETEEEIKNWMSI